MCVSLANLAYNSKASHQRGHWRITVHEAHAGPGSQQATLLARQFSNSRGSPGNVRRPLRPQPESRRWHAQQCD